MRVTRTFVDLPLQPGQSVQLPDDAVAHLGRVLRLQPGDICVLFNGDGHDYTATLTDIGKKNGTAQIDSVQAQTNESPLQITLIQGIARGDKMDWILQKATELGVAHIVPVHSQRGEVKLDGDRARKRHEHWRQVVISACEQSGRATVPTVAPPCDLNSMSIEAPVRLLLEPTADTDLRNLKLQDSAVAIAIGPEGGWSERDLAQLDAVGFSGLRLGPRILRTETAGIATIAALQAHFGDF